MAKAVERVWERLNKKIDNTIVSKLRMSFNIRTLSFAEINSEMMKVFFDNFYRYYENDQQYLRFIFIAFKNRMIDIYKREKKFVGMHFLRDPRPAYNKDEYSVADMENLLEYENPDLTDTTLEDVYMKETIRNIEQRLKDEKDITVFRMMLDGYKEIEIAKHLELTPMVIARIKRKSIWPSTKHALKLSDRQYERLCSSGRIYITT